MAGSMTVRQARLVLPDRVVQGDLVVEDGVISEISPRVDRAVGVQVDGRGCAVFPGLVDPHVHLDACEDLASMSAGAVAGGVTTVLGVRSAQTADALREELTNAAEGSHVHFGLYIRATAENHEEVEQAQRARGIWIGGDLLQSEAADAWFANATRMLVVDNRHPALYAARAAGFPDADDPAQHTVIDGIDSALQATQRALELARRHGRPTHLLHVSTADELEALAERPAALTAAVRTPHLFLDDDAYATLGTHAVTSPPLRGARHGSALWGALQQGALSMVTSGHLPVRAESKNRPYPQTDLGMPGVQFTLPLLIDRVARGGCTLSDVARWTAEAPATILKVPRKGRLETGYDGDLVLVDLELERTIGTDADVLGASGWSPWAGRTLRGWPILTVLLGQPVFRDGEILPGMQGREI